LKHSCTAQLPGGAAEKAAFLPGRNRARQQGFGPDTTAGPSSSRRDRGGFSQTTMLRCRRALAVTLSVTIAERARMADVQRNPNQQARIAQGANIQTPSTASARIYDKKRNIVTK